jgi:hypothetical protein
MRKFFTCFALFALPFFVTVGVPTLLLGWAGELSGVRVAIARQRCSPSLRFGLALSYPAKAYKLAMVESRDVDVLAIGSSRIMQVRESWFLTPDRFFNLGGIVSTPGDWATLARRLPRGTTPSVALIALDPWFWNATWTAHNPDEPGEMSADVNALNTIQRHWWSFLRDIRSHTVPLGDLIMNPGIGLTARIHGGGFRADGSYDYGWYLEHPDDDRHWDPHFKQTFDRIAHGTERFERASEPDGRGEASLRALLSELHARGCKVIGFFPPFAPSVATRMKQTGGYGYIDKLPARLRAIFAEHSDAFFDFSDPSAIDASDAEFIDGYHGSERTYAALVLRIADRVPELAARISPGELARRLANAGRFGLPGSDP